MQVCNPLIPAQPPGLCHAISPHLSGVLQGTSSSAAETERLRGTFCPTSRENSIPRSRPHPGQPRLSQSSSHPSGQLHLDRWSQQVEVVPLPPALARSSSCVSGTSTRAVPFIPALPPHPPTDTGLGNADRIMKSCTIYYKKAIR